MTRGEILLAQMDQVYDRLIRQLAGLTGEEYFWQPVPDCWTIHQDDHGDWLIDYEVNPDPPPFTTIGWRLVHLADCKVMYHEWAFGPQRLTFPDLVPPPTVAGAMDRLREGQALLRAALGSLDEQDLDRPVRTNWGEQWPAWRIFFDDDRPRRRTRCRDLLRARPVPA